MALIKQLSPGLSQAEQPAPARSVWRGQLLLLPASLAAGLALWQGLVLYTGLPAFILPAPAAVAARLAAAAADGSLLRNALVTLGEALSGLALGLSVAAVLGYVIAQSRLVEQITAPYIVASQSVPVVAIAPLLIIWFGSGLLSKVLICALIVFFPVLINVIVGVRSVEPDLRDMLRSLRASRWQTFVHLELPAAMPLLLGGLKIGATLSIIGAVVGEFAGADSGLGFLINAGRGQFDTALVFVAVLALVVMALALYASVVLLEKALLAWKD